MKIYTKTGDGGETGLFAGPRVPKDDPRIEAYGTVDELNSTLGLVRCELQDDDLDTLLATIQNHLFTVGAELATPESERHRVALIGESQITPLEQAIDRLEGELTPLTQFILPGGCRAAAALHQSRTVCRRAERRVVTLQKHGELSAGESSDSHVVEYLNRLGDLLFVMARCANSRAKVADVAWQQMD